jgi:hypothetical protein
MDAPAVPFEIVPLEPAGKAASNGEVTVCLAEFEGRMFRRRAVKGLGGPNPQHVEWLVVELNGVRVYISGRDVVVSTRDMYP